MNFYYTLLEQYQLMESLESVISANPGIERKIIEHYHKYALPDNNKKDRLLNHVLKMHDSGAITPDTAHLLKPHLTALAATNQLHQLKHLNTLVDHINATKGIMDKAVTKKERMDKDTPTVFEDENVIVKQHLTHESAIKGARLHPENPMYKETAEPCKAQWCVSADSEEGATNFKNYTKGIDEDEDYPLYTIHNKKTKRTTAFVANPYKTDENDEGREMVNEKEALDQNDRLEIRDEHDEIVSPIQLLHANPSLKDTHIGKFLFDHYPNSTHFVNADRKALEKGLTHTDPFMRELAISHPDATEDDITNALNDPIETVRKMAMRHPKANVDHITKALKDSSPMVRAQAIKHSNVTSKHIDSVLDNIDDDEDEITIRSIAAAHKNATSDHITKALQDPASDVYAEAAWNENGNITPDHIHTILTHHDKHIRPAGIMHFSTASVKNIDTALKNSNSKIRSGVFNFRLKNINTDHIDKGLQDSSISVRRAAQNYANSIGYKK